MKTRLVRIGNSRGIRIPKPLIEQTNLLEDVELVVQRNGLMIRSTARPRAGWAKAFEDMAKRGDDALLDGAPLGLTGWDEDEWKW